jgi:hypothetical protein
MLALTVAIVVSVLLTARSLRIRDYTYQRSWSPVATLIGYLVFLGIGAAAGWVGWRAATAIGWKPTDSHLFRGVVYGSFGNAIVRVHLRRIPNGGTEEAFTVLTVLSDFVTGVLDVRVPNAVSRRLEQMRPEALAQFVYYTFYRFVAQDERYSERDRKLFEVTIASDVEVLLYGSPAAQLRTKSSLRALAEEWTVRYKIRRPEPERT